MDLILQVFYNLLSSVTLSAAIPNEFCNFGCPLLTLICLIPFYSAIKNAGSYKKAFFSGFIFTCTTHIFSSFWLAYFKNFAILTLGASAAGTGFIGGFLSLFLYLPFADDKALSGRTVFKPFKATLSFRIFYFAGVYTVYEWVKSTGYLGYPWGTLSSAVYKWHCLTQIAAITGRYGITFLLALFNALAAESIELYFSEKNEKSKLKKLSSRYINLFDIKNAAVTAGLLTVLTLIYGSYELNKKRIPQKYLSTILVQQNKDPWKEKKDHDSILRSQELTKSKIDELAEEGKRPDLVVWSEGCLKSPFPGAKEVYSVYPAEKPLFDFIREINVPFLLGGSYIKSRENQVYNNTAMIFDSESNFRGFYGKNHLVPFAETIPGREIPEVRRIVKKIIGISAGWTPGDQFTMFNVPASWNPERILPETKTIDLFKSHETQKILQNQRPGVLLSAPICFDDAFPDVMGRMFAYGAELFVNITDDSWSLKKSSEFQHFVIASYASIEYRTTMIRSANSGYSVVILPTGKILYDEPLFQTSAIACDVPVYQREKTIYFRFGNWLPHLLVLLLVIFCLYSFETFVNWDYIPSERKKNRKHKKNL